MPGARCARSRACSVVSTRVSHHGHTGNTRHSPRNGFNGFLRALPGDRAFLSPSSRRINPARLERQRRGVRTTRLRRPRHALFVSSAFASTASRLTSVTIAKRPSGRRDGMGYATDLGRARNGKFFDGGLDTPNHLDPLHKMAVYVNRRPVEHFRARTDGLTASERHLRLF